uniref:Uncharacterized protein n=1 Tax=Nelumbo nucifera TaxID=4432 RepID=A0A822XEI6_NELNU|nr:TPA_asm: hypothetical protein HUJ06_020203 [Nelumbo nucifera]
MNERGGDAKKTKWPVIKPKRDLQITRLRDTHLFTVFRCRVSSLLLNLGRSLKLQNLLVSSTKGVLVQQKGKRIETTIAFQ